MAANEGNTTECAACVMLRAKAEQAAEECDRSREADARVLLRRHVRLEHGRELPVPMW
ncbi:hypothetical protein [Streptomyces sp. WMMB 714]|uniref:hypothetical protein n=1 Tax=Streptomyces sp. WMMB 714 TaxID=1286822 RepID=UPI00131C6438|nr:hypothetical protein [Streptomyces sp. WMMB 714]